MSDLFYLQVTKEIKQVIEAEEPFLNSLDKISISSKFNCQNRSIKQIVGHMIDSASNNLHRIVHLQYNETPLVFPNYATNGNNDKWIAAQGEEVSLRTIVLDYPRHLKLHVNEVHELYNS